jgi:hypothetical protein
MMIPATKVGLIIGKGGETIKSLIVSRGRERRVAVTALWKACIFSRQLKAVLELANFDECRSEIDVEENKNFDREKSVESALSYFQRNWKFSFSMDEVSILRCGETDNHHYCEAGFNGDVNEAYFDVKATVALLFQFSLVGRNVLERA